MPDDIGYKKIFKNNWKKVHLRSDFRENEILPWVRLEPTKPRAEIEKFFIRFLVQLKIAKSPFEINWPLPTELSRPLLKRAPNLSKLKLKISQGKIGEISEFQLGPMEKWPLVIFPLYTNFLNLKKGFSNLEPEGQGRRIIMGVTRLLLLGLFYTIQMQIYVLFCTRL